MNQFSKIIKYIAIAFAVFLIISIVTGIVYVLSHFGNIFIWDEKIETKELPTTENIESLEIDVKSVNVIIKNSNEFKIETNNKYVSHNQENDKLIIKQSKHNWFNLGKTDLIIYLPSKILENVKLENGAGTINIEYIGANNLDLNLGAGKVVINEVESLNSTKIDGGAGEIEIKRGIMNNLDLNMGVGKVTITSKLVGNSEIDAGVGELNLILLGKDYNINVEKGIGSVKIDGNNVTTYNNGNKKIDIDGGVGSINIDFTEAVEIHAFANFTRTYKLLNITNGQEENSYYLTLQVFQGEVDTVLVKNILENLEIGQNYEFTFERDVTEPLNDNIDSIFKNTEIKSIVKTEKQGLDQIQDKIN